MQFLVSLVHDLSVNVTGVGLFQLSFSETRSLFLLDCFERISRLSASFANI